MTAVEKRFLTGFRSEDADTPGLVQEDDGTVWLVAPDGTRTQISGGGSSSALAVVACASASDSQVSPLAPTLIPVPFGTVRYDPGNLWNAETFAFDIAEAGWYECGVFVESGSGITSDNCIPGGKIQVNGAGQNIVQAQYTPTPDAAAFGLPGWSGVTHLAIGDSVEVDLLSGSSVGTEEDPSLLTVIHLSFYISMIRAD